VPDYTISYWRLRENEHTPEWAQRLGLPVCALIANTKLSCNRFKERGKHRLTRVVLTFQVMIRPNTDLQPLARESLDLAREPPEAFVISEQMLHKDIAKPLELHRQ